MSDKVTRAFLQVPYDLLQDERLSLADAVVMSQIEFHAKGPDSCVASNRKMGLRTGISMRQVASSILKLEGLGLLEITKGKGNRRTIRCRICTVTMQNLHCNDAESAQPSHYNNERSKEKGESRGPLGDTLSSPDEETTDSDESEDSSADASSEQCEPVLRSTCLAPDSDPYLEDPRAVAFRQSMSRGPAKPSQVTLYPPQPTALQGDLPPNLLEMRRLMPTTPLVTPPC